MPSTKTASPRTKTTAAKTAKAPTKAPTKAASPRKTAAPAAKPSSPVRLATDLAPAAVVVPNVTVLPVAADVAEGAKAGDDTAPPAALKKQEMVARIAAASGAKRKDVKQILEATLQVLGDALSKGEELNLPPLGKVKVNRAKADGGTEILTLRLRRSDAQSGEQKGGKEGLAQDDEDD